MYKKCSQFCELYAHLYVIYMDIEFKQTELADLYEGKPIKDKRFKSNPKLVEKYIRTIDKLKTALNIEDLYRLHSLNYEKLSGDLAGRSSVRIDKKYRIIFEEINSASKQEDAITPIVVLSIEEISNHYA